MQVAVHNRSILEVPAQYKDVASVKVFNDNGQLLVLAMRHAGATVVVTADDPKFESFCAQYGISTKRAETVEV